MGTSDEPQLLQLRYRGEPWKMLVACILLNRTQRRQVDRVIDDLFLEYPTPEALASARIHDLASLLYPLGMHNTRARMLTRFATAWIDLEHGEDAYLCSRADEVAAISDLPGVGEYALDSYRMFVMHDPRVSPSDKELIRWQSWRESTSTAT